MESEEDEAAEPTWSHKVSIVAGPVEVTVEGPSEDPHGSAWDLFVQVWEKVQGSRVFEHDRSGAGSLGFSADLTQDRGCPPYNGEQQWDDAGSGSTAPVR